MSNIKTQTGKVIGRSLNAYHSRVKPKIDELKFKESYQGKIIDCMVGEVDDNYIETPETDVPIVKLEHSREGLVKIPTIKGKTILVDADGNETDTPAEGCKLVSVGEAEDNKMIILSKNKNLFDLNTWKDVVYGDKKLSDLMDLKNNSIKITGLSNDSYTSTGATGGDKPRKDEYNCLIKVKPNTTYTLSMKVEGSANRINYIQEYDGNYNSLVLHHYGNSTNDCRTFTTKSNCKYIGFRIGVRGKGETLIYSNIQLEEKQSKTDYVEYKSHKTEILLDEPLRKINSDTYDEIVGNKLIQKTKKVVLDGSEHWSKRSANASETTYCFECRLTTRGVLQYSTQCKSNNLPTNVGAWVDREHIWLNEWCLATVHISKEKIGEYDVELFKEWLTNNPIELIYQIEPIIEELPNSITLQGFDDTTMYIENSITPTVSYGYNALIPYKEELSKQKEEVETNTLDIENNIIPYLMDMEFNLMLMEDNE